MMKKMNWLLGVFKVNVMLRRIAQRCSMGIATGARGPFDEFPIWGTSHPLSSSRCHGFNIMAASPNSTIESTVTIPIFITNERPVMVFRFMLTRIRRFDKNMSRLWSLPLWPRTSFEYNEERVLTFKMRLQFLVRDGPHLWKNTLF